MISLNPCQRALAAISLRRCCVLDVVWTWGSERFCLLESDLIHYFICLSVFYFMFSSFLFHFICLCTSIYFQKLNLLKSILLLIFYVFLTYLFTQKMFHIFFFFCSTTTRGGFWPSLQGYSTSFYFQSAPSDSCPEESYRLWSVLVCDLGTSRRRRLKLVKGCKFRIEKKIIKLEIRELKFFLHHFVWNRRECLNSFSAKTRKT
jgi:hypothetical protein